VGDSVMLAADFERFEGASEGPLKVGETAVIEVDEGPSEVMPFRVRARGQVWFYAAGALERVSPKSTDSVGCLDIF